jgi:outer membrane protein OmpA-like peptidoglycan-associated protein
MLSEGYIFLQGNYRLSLNSSNLDNNTFYSLGFTQTIKPAKPAAVKEVPMPVIEVKDRDKDGVPDSLDACPDTPGLASLNGCPDKDGDGIADKDDKCPDVPGLAKYNGCPIPDTDKDGINDEEDKCPTVRGVAKYNGCPIPDRDNDGVNDEEDKCPDLAGTVENHGCPVIQQEVKKKIDIAAKNIYFATGSAKLLAKSNKSLNEVATILNNDTNLKLNVNGYTDNTGVAQKNQVLSENRARAVYDYLVKKGISDSRLKSAGFGQDNPVADNKTAAGRAKNRRVELQLHYD